MRFGIDLVPGRLYLFIGIGLSIIAQLNGYITNGYTLILTSHYTPEDLKVAEAKIAYLKNLKKIASGCKTAGEFRAKVKEQYPDYSGENYLDMTAGFFFA